MIREAKNSPRITVGELQRKVASWGHQVSKTTIRRHLHANKLFGNYYHKHGHANEKSLSCHFTTNVSTWSLLNANWNFDWNCVSMVRWNSKLSCTRSFMNFMKYQHFQSESFPAAPARKLKLGCCWIFQQDNDPKHTSKSTQKWLTEHKSSFCHGHLSPLT